MVKSEPVMPRRSVLKSAGLAAGAGLLSGLTRPAHAADDVMWSQDYQAKKGDVPLYMFRKRLGAPKAGEPSRPILFLVHGSSVTWRIFDLDAPGHGEYSMMNVFARWGYDVWTMDHENYGKSGHTNGNSDIASGAQDLKAAMHVVVKETGRQKAHFMGESSGALRAGLYAEIEPDRVDRLVLAAFTYKGVLLVRGEYDGIATVEDLFDFYRQLPHGDKQLVILPNTAHSVAVAINRHLFWHAVHGFLGMPAPTAI